MKICPNCGNSIEDEVMFCTYCGFNMSNANGGFQQPPQQPQQQAANPYYNQAPYVSNPTDHTADFTAQDISENKVMAMFPYLMGVFGIIVALLASSQSKYVYFHVKEASKLLVVQTLTAVLTAILCWTFIVPVAAGIFLIVLFVVKIICFVNVCKGKAKEAPIISGFSFLK